MPWIFNPSKTHETFLNLAGEARYMPGKKRVYFKPEDLSPSLCQKMASGRLVNLGGDPEPSQDTYSDIHHVHDIVLEQETSVAEGPIVPVEPEEPAKPKRRGRRKKKNDQ